MKKVILTLALLVISTNFISCQKSNAASKVKKENVVKAKERDKGLEKGAPVISFDRDTHEFGTVDEGAVIETSFVVTNKGESDLIITDAKTTCGCTVPVWPKEPIAPGTSSEIKVKFNTRGKKNKQTKTVTLYTNTENGRETVKVTGMVKPKKKPNA